MLIASALQPFAKHITFGNLKELEQELFSKSLSEFDPEKYKNSRVVIKGCGEVAVPVSVYMKITELLKPHVKSIMYGEPCSTVPVFKAK